MFIKSLQLKQVILLIYGCFLIALSVFKTSEILLPYIYQFEALLGGDKLMHLKLSAVLSILALFALIPNRKQGMRLLAHALGICFLLVTGLMLDELHQALISTRRFEWLDFVYGVSGISMGLVAYLTFVLLRLTQKRFI